MKNDQIENWMLFVGLFEEGTVRRRVSVDRSGLDINEGNDIHWKRSGWCSVHEMPLIFTFIQIFWVFKKISTKFLFQNFVYLPKKYIILLLSFKFIILLHSNYFKN